MSSKGIKLGVKVQIFPLAVANGFSLNDCFVQSWSFFSPGDAQGKNTC